MAVRVSPFAPQAVHRRTLAQSFQADLPSHLFGEIRGLQPSGALAGAAHVNEPAPATFVAESLDVIEALHPASVARQRLRAA
jgi:hypothetical protein